MFYKKSCPQKFRNIHRKNLCQSLFLNRIVGLWPSASNFIEKETPAQVFPVNFAKSLRTHFYRMPPVAAVFLKKCFFLETNETNVGHIHFFSLAGDEAFFYIYICFFIVQWATRIWRQNSGIWHVCRFIIVIVIKANN